jgi:hypothetical protein
MDYSRNLIAFDLLLCWGYSQGGLCVRHPKSRGGLTGLTLLTTVRKKLRARNFVSFYHVIRLA